MAGTTCPCDSNVFFPDVANENYDACMKKHDVLYKQMKRVINKGPLPYQYMKIVL